MKKITSGIIRVLKFLALMLFAPLIIILAFLIKDKEYRDRDKHDEDYH